jgi:hypothetical protein
VSDNIRPISITIKYGKGYDDTWAVFQGSAPEVREDIISYFGFQREAVTDLTLSELVVAATDLAHGKGNAARFLGATVLPSQKAEAAPAQPAPASNEDPWAAASSSAPSKPAAPAAPAQPKDDDPNAWILGEIEKQTSVDGLKRLWAANQSFFSDASVMAAWKAKGRALSA